MLRLYRSFEAGQGSRMAEAIQKQPATNDLFPAFEYLPHLAVNGTAVRPADQPIRFPHIPAFNQSPPGSSQYVLLPGHELRVDRPHPALPSVVRPSEPAATVPTATALGGVSSPTTVSATAPAAVPALATQIEQIAEYLRRKRNELETEQTDLQLSALKQQTALWQEKELLRSQQLNIQMVQATLEILRRQLVDFGETLSREAGSNPVLVTRFELVCQAYFDAAQVTKLLDSGA